MGKIVYIDATKADNTGDGLTAGTAKKTWNAGYALMADGDTMLLRSGMCYDPNASGYSAFKRSNSSVGSYGGTASNPPILDSLIYQIPGTAGASGWASEGDGVWSKQISAYWGVTRLWVGATNTGVLSSQRNPGTAWSRTPNTGVGATAANIASIKATLNTTDIWFPGGSSLQYKLYVYTGSDTVDPPTFYNGLALQCNDATSVGSVAGISVSSCANVLISGITARGQSTNFEAVSSNTDPLPTSNIMFYRCNGTHMFANSHRVRNLAGNYTSPWMVVESVTFKECIGDSGSSQQEQEKNTGYGVLSGAMDMFSISHNANNCVAIDCQSINSMHIGALVGKFDNMVYGPSNSGYIRHTVKAASWTTYARGFASYAVNNTCFFKNCTSDGCNVRSQFSGAIQVTGSVWKNMRQSIRKPNTDGAWGIESYIINCGNTNYGNNRYLVIQPEGMRIAHNLVIDPWGPVAQFNQYEDTTYPITPNAFPSNSVFMYNNIIIDTRVSRAGKAWLEAEHTGSTLVGIQPIENNFIYKGEGISALIKWEFVNYATNAVAGAKNNFFDNPLVDQANLDNIKLSPASPCRGRGKFLGGGILSRNGVVFSSPPTVGPFEYPAKSPRTVIRPRVGQHLGRK